MNNDRGIALVIALILLLVLSLSVMSAGRELVLQEKLIASTRDNYNALLAAENGLSQARSFLGHLYQTSSVLEVGSVIPFSETGIGGFYQLEYAPRDVFYKRNGLWQSGKTISMNETSNTAQYHTVNFYLVDMGRYLLDNGSLRKGSLKKGSLKKGSLRKDSLDDEMLDEGLLNKSFGDFEVNQLIRVVSRSIASNGRSESVLSADFIIKNITLNNNGYKFDEISMLSWQEFYRD